MSVILDGKAVSVDLKNEIRDKVLSFKQKNGIIPKLTVILVGNDPASAVYVRNKNKACEYVGIESGIITYPEDVPEKDILDRIDQLNNDTSVSGILVQLPLPRALDEKKIILSIRPEKDVDCFNPFNVGLLYHPGNDTFLPCTPNGIIRIIDYYGISLKGKNAVVVGRSDIVGKPMAMMLLARDATVTVCHSKTVDLKQHTSCADILIAAVGRPGFITADMVKPGAVVIDVGINRTGDGKLVGDVDFDTVKNVASYITPVPGGVGPMTVAVLMENTLKAAVKQCEL